MQVSEHTVIDCIFLGLHSIFRRGKFKRLEQGVANLIGSRNSVIYQGIEIFEKGH